MRTILISFFILLSITGENLAETVSYSTPEWRPMFYKEKDTFKGFYYEIINEIFHKQMGVKVKYSITPWKRAQKYAEIGIIDMILTVPTKKRLAYAIKSERPIYKLYLHIYTYKNHKKLDKIRKIKSAKDILQLNLTPVTNLGNGWHKQKIDSHGIDTHYVPKEDNIVKFLASRRADIMIEAVIPMNYKIKQYGLESEIVLTEARFGPINFHLLISKKSKFASRMPEINRTVDMLFKKGVIQKLTKKYTKLK